MIRQEPYASPAAFRRALTDALRAKAATDKWSLVQLQRQMAYDRLLERLYLIDQGWILKGAAALLARNIGVRASLDIDVYRDTTREVAERDLRAAATLDLGDWFRFAVAPSQPVGDSENATRLPTTAFVGTTVWAAFHVDIVGSELRMTGQPDDVPPLARVLMPNVDQHGYRAYPLVDHIADKIAAMYEPHGADGRASTRFRDLVDLVAIVTVAAIQADPQRTALVSEFNRRGLPLPTKFEIPEVALWTVGYGREASRSLLPTAHTLTQAMEIVSPFIDPVLRDEAVGVWDAGVGAWVRQQ